MTAPRLTLLLTSLAALAPAAGRAGDADVFENRVKPVSGQLYEKAGKLELTIPTAQLSLNDAFFAKYMAGAKLGYHFNEYLSVGITGSGGFSSATGSTTTCAANAGCKPASQTALNQLPGDIKWIVGAEVAWAPIYGKLNLFAEKAIHFDLGVLGGVDMVSYRDVLTATEALSGASPGNATSIGGHAGIGARVFFAGFMALRLELKDLVYSVSHLPSGNIQTQLLADVGLSFFFPVAHGSAP